MVIWYLDRVKVVVFLLRTRDMDVLGKRSLDGVINAGRDPSLVSTFLGEETRHFFRTDLVFPGP